MALFLFIVAIIIIVTSHTPEEWEESFKNVEE